MTLIEITIKDWLGEKGHLPTHILMDSVKRETKRERYENYGARKKNKKD